MMAFKLKIVMKKTDLNQGVLLWKSLCYTNKSLSTFLRSLPIEKIKLLKLRMLVSGSHVGLPVSSLRILRVPVHRVNTPSSHFRQDKPSWKLWIKNGSLWEKQPSSRNIWLDVYMKPNIPHVICSISAIKSWNWSKNTLHLKFRFTFRRFREA